MKALTVQQPWAWAIIHGGKSVENRTQAWSYRGPLAIHAGQRLSDRGMESPLIGGALRRLNHVVPEGISHPALVQDYGHLWGATIHRGAIIGVVDLVDVHYAEPEWIDPTTRVGTAACCESAWAEQSYEEHGGRTRRDIVHLVLENPRPLAEPILCRGALGLWAPSADVLDQLQAVV